MIREAEILQKLQKGEVTWPPLRLAMTSGMVDQWDAIDMVLRVEWEGASGDFAVEIKSPGTTRQVREAAVRIKALAARAGLLPLVVVPWLSEEELGFLEMEKVSGLDLCGNGVLEIPGRVLVRRTGEPNLYPMSSPIKNIYRGAASLVARAFLLRSSFTSLTELREFILARGAPIAMSTVSKCIRQLSEDWIISRDGATRSAEVGVRLLQPDKLMERLLANYRPIESRRRWVGRVDLPKEEIERRLAQIATGRGWILALTGSTSARAYSGLVESAAIEVYTRQEAADILTALETPAVEGEAFANLALRETDDDFAFFDRRLQGSSPIGSPIQAWLELSMGDSRQRQAAGQVRDHILKSLGDVLP